LFSALGDAGWSGIGRDGDSGGTPHIQRTPEPNPGDDELSQIDLYQALQQMGMGGDGGSNRTQARPEPNRKQVQRKATSSDGGNGSGPKVAVRNSGEPRIDRANSPTATATPNTHQDAPEDDRIAIDFAELADDVLQYVKRKLRIEFERRGRR